MVRLLFIVAKNESTDQTPTELIVQARYDDTCQQQKPLHTSLRKFHVAVTGLKKGTISPLSQYIILYEYIYRNICASIFYNFFLKNAPFLTIAIVASIPVILFQ